MARRHASDAAADPVVLSFAALYFAKQSFTSASMFAAGLTGSMLGLTFGAKRVQNSGALSPDASIARRQASDAALAAVGLFFAAAYLLTHSVTRTSMFTAGFCGRVVGVAFGANRAQKSLALRPDASMPLVLVSGLGLTSGVRLVAGLDVVSGVADFGLTVRAISAFAVGSGRVVGAVVTEAVWC